MLFKNESHSAKNVVQSKRVGLHLAGIMTPKTNYLNEQYLKYRIQLGEIHVRSELVGFIFYIFLAGPMLACQVASKWIGFDVNFIISIKM